MKKDKEFEREDLAVDRDIQLDSDNKQQIVAYLETLFDVNEKFNLQLDSEAGEWVNMYGIYNPLSDFLTVECVISKDNSSESFFYTPTTAESALIKELIAEKIKEEFGQTPTEFVCDLAHHEEKAYICTATRQPYWHRCDYWRDSHRLSVTMLKKEIITAEQLTASSCGRSSKRNKRKVKKWANNFGKESLCLLMFITPRNKRIVPGRQI